MFYRMEIVLVAKRLRIIQDCFNNKFYIKCIFSGLYKQWNIGGAEKETHRAHLSTQGTTRGKSDVVQQKALRNKDDYFLTRNF